jgi:2-polyprenyl-6-methoxyphenol hydroxylase-like FAD-dependent oxidoreductase
VGGGPAGIMLGYLLARKGVEVTVLEKHKDFFRDFRGDTVHPSTLELMYELGILADFLRVPHQKLTSVGGIFGDFPFKAADFSHLPTHCKFVALMPQWDFLDFLSGQAKKYPSFDLRMEHEAVDLLRDSGRIVGVSARTPEGDTEIHASLVVGCDGRQSITRQAAGLEVREFGVPIDVLWFRISRGTNDPEQLLGNFNYGKALVLINRGDYFQAGLIIRKGSFDEIKARGLEVFHNLLHQIAPYLGERTNEITDWEQVKLLTVQINRLRQWYRPGLLCIGDAAHAMSPAGGVGINLAIQDAVATANILGDALRDKRVNTDSLAAVQRRREFPTRVTQAIQANAHNAFAKVFQNPGPAHAPWQLKVAAQIPGVQRVLARVIGIGVLPEHIREANRPPECKAQPLVKIAVGIGLLAATAALAVRAAKKYSRKKVRLAWS